LDCTASAGIARSQQLKPPCMSNDRLFGLDADPAYQPNGRSDIQGVPSGNAVKQDKGARIFAVIAILLFACYFIGALTANAQEKSAVAKHGTEQPAVGSSCPYTLRLLQIDELYGLHSRGSRSAGPCVSHHTSGSESLASCSRQIWPLARMRAR
jgi:hypothetical protein